MKKISNNYIRTLTKSYKLWFVFKDVNKYAPIGHNIDVKVDKKKLARFILENYEALKATKTEFQKKRHEDLFLSGKISKFPPLKAYTIKELIERKNSISDAERFHKYYKNGSELAFDDCIKIFLDNFDVSVIDMSISGINFEKEVFIGYISEFKGVNIKTSWGCNVGYCVSGGDVSTCKYNYCVLEEAA